MKLSLASSSLYWKVVVSLEKLAWLHLIAILVV
jgi:hypothetical protein